MAPSTRACHDWFVGAGGTESRELMRFVSKLLLFACALVGLGACGSESTPATDPIGTTSSPIVNGELDTGTAHDDVVYLTFVVDAATGEGGACTGTLIAPNVVATARHCVSQTDSSIYPPRAGADFDTKDMGVFLHTDPTGTGAFRAPDGKVIRIVHDSSTTIGSHDFALVVLDKNVSTTYSQVRLATPPTTAEPVFVVGYGVTENDTPPVADPHERYWRDGLSIVLIGPSTDGLVLQNEIMLGESICEGDSGGPVKDDATGALLAVTSRGGNGTSPIPSQPWSTCVGEGTQNLFTRVDAFAAMIRATLAQYGEIAWEEGQPKPPDPTTTTTQGVLGTPCASPGQCVSSLCVSVDGAQVCSQTCNDADAPCPSGFACTSGYCVASSVLDPGSSDDDAGTTADAQASGGGSGGGCSLSDFHASGTSSGVPTGGLVLVASAWLGVWLRRRAAVQRQFRW